MYLFADIKIPSIIGPYIGTKVHCLVLFGDAVDPSRPLLSKRGKNFSERNKKRFYSEIFASSSFQLMPYYTGIKIDLSPIFNKSLICGYMLS